MDYCSGDRLFIVIRKMDHYAEFYLIDDFGDLQIAWNLIPYGYALSEEQVI